MTTPAGKKHQNNHMDNGIMDSIAALRSVLMLDTPIRDVLAVGRNGNDRKQQAQKQLLFSPSSITQATTPATHANTPMSRTNTSTRKRSSSSPLFKTPTPGRLPRSPEVQQSATKVLEKKIELLEASHAELEGRLMGEIDQRETLKTTYDKLSEFQAKQSSQLEQITASRDTFRDESIALKKTLETERKNHSKTIAFLKNTTSNAIQSEVLRERESFRRDTERLKKRLQKSDSRYAESEVLVKSLTREVDKLNADFKEFKRKQELAMQKRMESHAREIAILQDKIEQTESGLVEQINKERKGAEEAYEKLQKVQKSRSKLKEEYTTEREKIKSETSKLQESLKEAADARKESERKLEEATNEVSKLRQQVIDDRLARRESEGKLEKLTTELDAANKKLAANEKLKSERDDLERQLRDTKSSKLSTEQGQPVPNEESQHLRSENTTLQQQLKGVEVNRNQIQIELQETQMELDGLKQNLEEAERIETQNEELVARLKSMSDELAGVKDLQEELKACKSDKKDQEQLIQNLELELEETKRISANTTGVGPSNDINGSNDSVVVHNLREELKKTKSELANAKEKLDISRLSNLNRLVEVATHREKVRDLEGDLEELEEKLNGENPETEETDERKHATGVDEAPRKRRKMRENSQELYSHDDDDVVL